MAAQEEKIEAMDEFANKLIKGRNYAVDDVARRALLMEKCAVRRTMLEDSLNTNSLRETAMKQTLDE